MHEVSCMNMLGDQVLPQGILSIHVSVYKDREKCAVSNIEHCQHSWFDSNFQAVICGGIAIDFNFRGYLLQHVEFERQFL